MCNNTSLFQIEDIYSPYENCDMVDQQFAPPTYSLFGTKVFSLLLKTALFDDETTFYHFTGLVRNSDLDCALAMCI